MLDIGRQIPKPLFHAGPRLLAQVVDELRVGLIGRALVRVPGEDIRADLVLDRLRQARVVEDQVVEAEREVYFDRPGLRKFR